MLPWTDNRYQYFPILRFKPAELLALRELPSGDKERLTPLVPIAPAPNAKKFEHTLKRLDAARGASPLRFIIDLFDGAPSLSLDTEVGRIFRSFCDPSEGYRNWVEFVQQYPHFIPVLRTEGDPSDQDFRRQVERLEAMGRGIVVRLRAGTAKAIERIQIVREITSASNLCVFLDYSQIDRVVQPVILNAVSVCSRIAAVNAGSESNIVVAASSFPYSFSGDAVTEIPISERTLFDAVQRQTGNQPDINLIYGDYGSARAVDRGGWGGPPRIDYSTRNAWYYCRQPNEQRSAGLESAAEIIRNHRCWVPDLNLWGTQKIIEASEGKTGDLATTWGPSAVRINIHLHVQARYNDSWEQSLETDDDWLD